MKHMRFNYRAGVTKQKRKIWLLIPCALFAVGGYLLFNTLSPSMSGAVFGESQDVARQLVIEKPNPNEDRLYIPQINVDTKIVNVDGNETAALEKGAVHRSPDSGNPRSGGNFILAAHRFELGLTPDKTRTKSPFYHIDQLNQGDQLYLDYDGTRYAYEVTDRKTVSPAATTIEKRTETPQLTLYSYELVGPSTGREVVIAKPIGTVAWIDGAPKIQPL